MAISATLKASGEFGLTTTVGGALVSTTLSAITFAPNSLVVVVLGSTKADATATGLTCTASGLTFTDNAHASQLVANKADQVILTAPDAAGGSRSIAITSGTKKCFGLFYAVYEVTGHDTTTPIGATATQADNLTDGTKTMTLSAAPAASSVVIAGVSVDTDPGLNTIDPGSTLTESAEGDSSASFYGAMEVETRTGSTSTTVDWADVRAGASVPVYSSAGAAIEIIAAAVPAEAFAAPWLQIPPGRISPAGRWTPTQGDVEVASTAVTGTLASTLSDATLAASGSEVITGTAASTLAGATLAASGSEVFTGTLGTTLSGATLAASGSEVITGTFATTLGGATLAASGTVANPVTGTLAATLSGATLAASGNAGATAITGTLAATLAGATLAASGAEVFTGTFAATLSGATLAATGNERMTGTLAVTLTGVTLSASGVEVISGTLTTTLAGTTLAAAGTVASPPVTGTLTVALSGATLTAAGSIAAQATGTPPTIARAVVSIAIHESAVAPHHAARAEVEIPTTTARVTPHRTSARVTTPTLEGAL